MHRLTESVAATPAAAGGASSRIDPIVAQMAMRLAHDLRELKATQSIGLKVEKKRAMIEAYREWCDAQLAGTIAQGGVAAEILPTMMVWSIDIGDWSRALELAAFVLEHRLPLPSRYVRGAAPLLVEEMAEAAFKLQGKGERFPLEVLEAVEDLTSDVDMHDEIRAKLFKAIGVELDAAARTAAEAGEIALPLLSRSLVALQRAQDLHPRVGAKMTIKAVEKAIAATEQAGAAG
ncbi:phage terminase small subunit [uncultured Sphingomonas sp.]|uniref:phage terminase small subunit n=1 Tax=uncultured Sphingomonas sp. TaxID=158754 RepID=UPI0025EBB55D|nr:phage terminase small subunit [uncultured Sphingomonas sp.]